MVKPSLRPERQILRSGHPSVTGMDEVGRGAIAGCLAIGAVTVALETGSAPTGVNDSKLLSAAKREELAPKLARWAHASAIGIAEPAEIDRFGLTTCLRLAGLRALSELPQVDHVILDGSWNYLAARNNEYEQDVLWLTDEPEWPAIAVPPVTTVIKGDQRCSTVAAASVLAKVFRDNIMVQLAKEEPRFDWQANKGYSSASHSEAIARYGLTQHHRRSWTIAAADPGEIGDRFQDLASGA